MKKTNNKKIDITLNTLDESKIPIRKALYKKTTKKIVETLVNLSEINQNSAVFDNDFKTLSFEISFCNDKTIREINSTYRGKDKATDVITFALFVDDENSIVIDNNIELGEIIISTQTLERQAKENNNTLEVELYTLTTHGILHLLGFDHLTQKDYDFVVGIQEKIIKSL